LIISADQRAGDVMPDTSPEIMSIFCDALERTSAAERAAFLETACGADTALRARIEALLQAHVQAGGFLTDQTSPSAVIDGPLTERPGTVIGPYKLLEQIGEGGMGLVFVAEQQQPVRRKLALKVIKPGMDTRQVIARFEAERQALALMDHPNIARVVDGGTTPSGRPYFVMELVNGVPIARYCDEHRLTPRQRLELFVPVCQAIEHAHQKGIIHRDIKASNVLVAHYDDRPVPKVIDFGIAKATGDPDGLAWLTKRTLCTSFGSIVGTLEYMSPEQAGFNQLDIDTRSDIYSLGVLLYELLTGTTPLERKRFCDDQVLELLRTIREDDPPKPSTRLSTAKELAVLAANRGTELGKLKKLIRGELDWIVMRALEKDRARRYQTANSLATDVQHYLADETVRACPPSAWYRFRKFARRNKGAVAAAVAVTLMVLLGVVGLAVSNVLIAREKNDKELALRDREAALTMAQESERDARDQLFQALLQRARAERGSGRVGQRFESLNVIRRAAKIRRTPELATEAASALVLPDVEIARQWEAFPEGSVAIAFDAAFEHYARLDKRGVVTVCRWTGEREEVVTRLPVFGQPVFQGLSMSPDGRFAAYGHSGGVGRPDAGLRVWRLAEPSPTVVLDEVNVHLSTVAFRSDSQQLAFGQSDGSVSVYDLTAGQLIQRIELGGAPAHLAFHPRDQRLAIARGNAVRIFDIATGRELAALVHNADATWTNSVAWHPDGRRLAAACNDRKVHLWDTDANSESIAPLVHGHEGIRLGFDHSGDRLVSVGWEEVPSLWDTVTGRLLLKLPASIGLQISADDQVVGPEIHGNQVRLWRLAAGRELRVLRRRHADMSEKLTDPILNAKDGVLAVNALNHITLFELDTGEELAAVALPSELSCRPFCWDDSGALLTSGTSGLLMWPVRRDTNRPEILRVGPPQRVAPGLNSPFSVGASASSNGRIIGVPDGRFTIVFDRDHPDRSLRMGPQFDARFCAVTPEWTVTCSHWADGLGKGMRIWATPTGEHICDLPLTSEVMAKFSPDGRWLATVSAEGNPDTDGRLWETGSWREVLRFPSRSFAFSPDNRLLAITDAVGTIRLLEIPSGREIARLNGSAPDVFYLGCFTADGSRLIATAANQTICIWDLRAIREQLKELGLDWNWPEISPTELPRKLPRLLRAQVQLGDLAKPNLTSEERSRQAIERYRRAVEANPNDPNACNNLAWTYLTAPEALRDVSAALPLAEKAVRLESGNAMFVNTLGVAYYRAGRFREAVDVLRPNISRQPDSSLAYDLYFLAMSHYRLDQRERARDYYDWAVRSTKSQQSVTPSRAEELTVIRAEVEELLAIKKE
jgi:eukaryotic-like serine/threonine-protein kinase